MPDGLSTERCAELGGGKRLESPLGTEEVCAHLAEIFLGQLHDPCIVVQRGQDIDKPEQLRLERGIFHRQVDGRLRPPARIEQAGRPPAGTPGQVFTNRADTGFERGRVERHRFLLNQNERLSAVYTAVRDLNI